MSKGQDLYQVLGVERGASQHEIRKAFRRLAKELHPDKNAGNKELEERFKDVNAAYEVLGSASKRKLYDEFGDESLRSGFDAERTRAYRAQRSARTTSPDSGGFSFDPSEVFGDLFGGRTTQRRHDTKMSRRLVVEIDLAQAIHGAHVQVHIQAPQTCPTCGGQGGQRGAPPAKCKDCNGTGTTNTGGDRIRMSTTCQACGGEGWLQPPCATCNGLGAVTITLSL